MTEKRLAKMIEDIRAGRLAFKPLHEALGVRKDDLPQAMKGSEIAVEKLGER